MDTSVDQAVSPITGPLISLNIAELGSDCMLCNQSEAPYRLSFGSAKLSISASSASVSHDESVHGRLGIGGISSIVSYLCAAVRTSGDEADEASDDGERPEGDTDLGGAKESTPADVASTVTSNWNAFLLQIIFKESVMRVLKI